MKVRDAASFESKRRGGFVHPEFDVSSIRLSAEGNAEMLQEDRDAAWAIVAQLCKGTSVKPEDIQGKRRTFNIAEIRGRFCRKINADLGWGCVKIASFVFRDHSTVCHALSRRDRPLRLDPSDPIPAPEIPAAEPIAEEPELTGQQLACRAATNHMLAELGSRAYARFNVAGERPQLAPPPFG